MNPITVLIADDHAIVRMGLRSLLDSTRRFAVVGEAEDGGKAVLEARRLRPDVIVMDLMMPVKDGASATAEIISARPDSRILILTTFGSFNGVSRALEAGATGAILKNSSNEELIAALQEAAAGHRVISPEISRMLREDPPTPDLSARQQQVLSFIVQGKTNGEISDLLGIREDSVKKIVAATFEKIGAQNRADATGIALRKHLLT